MKCEGTHTSTGAKMPGSIHSEVFTVVTWGVCGGGGVGSNIHFLVCFPYVLYPYVEPTSLIPKT